jgi:hypothetical protein
MTEGDGPTPGIRRGRIGLYAASFGLLMVAALVFTVTTVGSLQSTRLLWVSAAFSIAALLAAVASVVAPRR